jgi:hypothetical protein
LFQRGVFAEIQTLEQIPFSCISSKMCKQLSVASRLNRALCVIIVALVLTGPSLIHAATVWNGPLISYTQPTPDPTQATNQDRIMPDVWLTRATSKGLFNAFSETNATALSPTNTEWAFGTATNYASLHFTNWLGWLNGASPTTLVGQQAVVHLISHDIYISIKITTWVASAGGGFAYQRSTPTPPNLSGASFNNGLFAFRFATDAGISYIVQSSTNLLNWVSLTTNVATGNSALFTNAMNPTGIEFYRVGRFTDP